MTTRPWVRGIVAAVGRVRYSLGTGDAIGLGYGSRSPAGRTSIFASHERVMGRAPLCSVELPYRNPETITAPARLSRLVRLRPGDDL